MVRRAPSRGANAASRTTATNQRHDPASRATVTIERDRLLYVYCAVRRPVVAARLRKLPAMPDGAAPRLLALTKDISLVVADVGADTYRADAIESRLTDLDWVARCGSAHHAVADTLALKHTVVPFRLFTLFSNEERARATLGAAAPRIAAAVARVRGRAEWVLRIAVPEAARSAPEQPDQRRTPTSGTAFLAQKAAARRAASERAAIVRSDADAVFDRLSAVADAANRRPPEAATGLVLDAAFLVRARQQPAFRRQLAIASRRLLAHGCRVSLTGPWPPYSFVDFAEHDVA